MTNLSDLIACSGTWDGTCRVQAFGPADESASRLTVTPAVRDTFVRLDQTWASKGKPQAGTMLVGHDPATGVATAHWADSFHTGRTAMTFTGRFEPAAGLVVHGHFAVGDGPDWGWRIQLQLRDGRLAMDMVCIDPTGKEEGGVQASFDRA